MLGQRETQPSTLDSLCAFEAKLISMLAPAEIHTFKYGNICIGLETQGASAGEVVVSLLAQEMRDFCLLDRVPFSVLDQFAKFLLPVIEAARATRMRIGPLGGKTAETLCTLLRAQQSNFVFETAVLSVEPLLDKRSKGEASKRSLRRALRKSDRAGLAFSSESFSAAEMMSLHGKRWGHNRSVRFFEMMAEFVNEPYCECVSMKGADGVLVAQQIDFCFSDERYYYHSVWRQAEHAGLGTSLLAESIRRFYQDPGMRIYSFGRGGEEYKYRYAQYVRMNHYVAGFRTNDLELWQ